MLIKECDTHNRSLTLISGLVTLITGGYAHTVARSYMQKMVGRFLDKALLVRIVVLRRLSHGFPISSVVGQAPGQGAV